jgi:23S rRNA (cytosine1962-C5)-methyltransferase
MTTDAPRKRSSSGGGGRGVGTSGNATGRRRRPGDAAAEPPPAASPASYPSPFSARPVHLTLAKDLGRSLMAGSPWVYRDALAPASVEALTARQQASLAPASPAGVVRPGALALVKAGVVRPGALALVKAADGTILAKGFVDPASPIAFRALATRERLDEDFVLGRLGRCADLRRAILPACPASPTTGYRLVNGEGDGLPGLHVDVYGDVAVVKLDGEGAEAFYLGLVARWLSAPDSRAGAGGAAGGGGACRGPVRTVWLKYRRARGGGGGGGDDDDDEEDDYDEGEEGGQGRGGAKKKDAPAAAAAAAAASDAARGRALFGPPPSSARPVPFFEHGVRFTADVVRGQKTGFFLDQRDNRVRLRPLCAGGARVLNLFAYSGGFSVHAGAAGAGRVTSVDASAGACAAAEAHWRANGLDPAAHEAVCADVFEFLEGARASATAFDVVICDPPSFAASAAAAARGGAAAGAYRRVFAASAQAVRPGGVLALSSCSSHVSRADFDGMVTDALARAKRKGLCLGGVFGAGLDHPFPLAAPALEYLQFAVYLLD